MLSPPLIKKILTNWYVPFLLDSDYIVFEAIYASLPLNFNWEFVP